MTDYSKYEVVHSRTTIDEVFAEHFKDFLKEDALGSRVFLDAVMKWQDRTKHACEAMLRKRIERELEDKEPEYCVNCGNDLYD